MTQKDIDKEQAVADCIKYGTPTLGVDHSNYYKPLPFHGPLPASTLKAPELYKCNFCGCSTNAKQRFCCVAGRDADKENE